MAHRQPGRPEIRDKFFGSRWATDKMASPLQLHQRHVFGPQGADFSGQRVLHFLNLAAADMDSQKLKNSTRYLFGVPFGLLRKSRANVRQELILLAFRNGFTVRMPAFVVEAA